MSANNDTRKEEDELEKDVMKDKAGAQTIRTPSSWALWLLSVGLDCLLYPILGFSRLVSLSFRPW